MSGVELKEGSQVEISQGHEDATSTTNCSKKEDNMKGTHGSVDANEVSLESCTLTDKGTECSGNLSAEPACGVTDAEGGTIILKNGDKEQIQDVLNSLQTCKDLSSFKCLDLNDVYTPSITAWQSKQLVLRALKLLPELQQFCYTWKAYSGIYESIGHWYEMLLSFLQLMPALKYVAIINENKFMTDGSVLNIKDPFPKLEKLDCFAEAFLPANVCRSALSVNSTISTLVTSLSCAFDSSMLPNLKHLSVYMSADQDQHLKTLTFLQSPLEVLKVRYCDTIEIEYLRSWFSIIKHFRGTLKQLHLELPLNCYGDFKCSQLTELTMDLGGLTRVNTRGKLDVWIVWMEEGIYDVLYHLKNLQKLKILAWNVDHFEPTVDDTQQSMKEWLEEKLNDFAEVLFTKMEHLKTIQVQVSSEEYSEWHKAEFLFTLE